MMLLATIICIINNMMLLYLLLDRSLFNIFLLIYYYLALDIMTYHWVCDGAVGPDIDHNQIIYTMQPPMAAENVVELMI